MQCVACWPKAMSTELKLRCGIMFTVAVSIKPPLLCTLPFPLMYHGFLSQFSISHCPVWCIKRHTFLMQRYKYTCRLGQPILVHCKNSCFNLAIVGGSDVWEVEWSSASFWWKDFCMVLIFFRALESNLIACDLIVALSSSQRLLK